MFRDFDLLSIAEKSSRFHYIIDYCLWQLKWGNANFLRETFSHFVEGLEKKLYQSDSKDADIGLIFFRNFVIIGLAAKKYDYVEKFINDYGNEIKGEMKDDTLALSYAMLYYEKKEYDKSLDCLNKVSSSFGLFKLSTKHILIKIYYETEQYDSFFSLLDTYKHYLKNEKIISSLIRAYHTNFLNYLTILIRIKSSGLTDDLLQIKNEIKHNENMDYRHKLWLIEKAEELEKLEEPVT
jgi:tetratricopeptide (TPR) repeat protein